MDKKEKAEAIAILIFVLWFLLYNSLFYSNYVGAYNYGKDIYFYYTSNMADGPGGMPLAYPSLSLLYFDAIRFIAPAAISFMYVFEFLSLIWFILLFYIYSREFSLEETTKIFFLFAPLFLLVILRVEILAILLAIASVYLFNKGHRMAGWSLALISVFVKVMPVVLLPLFFVLELKKGKDGLLRMLGAAVLAAILFFSSSAANVYSLQSNTVSRGLQVESTYASLLLFANLFQPLGITVAYNYGSYHLVLPPSFDFLSPLSLVLLVGSGIGVLLLFYFDKKNEERLWLYSFLMLSATLLFFKVLSPQFILWLLAFGVFLIKDKQLKSLYSLLLALSLLTLIFYPFFFQFLIEMNAVGVILVLLRNILLAAIFVYVLRSALTSRK